MVVFVSLDAKSVIPLRQLVGTAVFLKGEICGFYVLLPPNYDIVLTFVLVDQLHRIRYSVDRSWFLHFGGVFPRELPA